MCERRGWLRRLANAGLRLANGLRLHAENVSPLVPNDLFVAHLSIYDFALPWARERRVLDLGSGTGYGAAYWAERGAGEVVGVDLDPGSVRFAQRRYRDPRLRFLCADVTHLPPRLGRFELVFSSNVFEHLTDVEAGLQAVEEHLAPGGVFLLVVPPITDEASLAENLKNPFHRTNLPVPEWQQRLEARFAEVQPYRHLPKAEVQPDFASPWPSRLAVGDFEFSPVTAEELVRAGSLGAVWVCRRGTAEQSVPA